jgi:hypothetical protein
VSFPFSVFYIPSGGSIYPIMTNLTPNQQKAVSVMPATASEIADHLGYHSTSGVYDLLKRAERRDPTVSFTSTDGVWDCQRVVSDGGTTTAAAPATTRMTTGEKSSRTKTINDWLTRTERELAERLAETDAPVIERPQRDGNLDMVMFRTDDHFGEIETDVTRDGELVESFNSEIARDRIFQHLTMSLGWAEEMEDFGYEFDTFNLLLNGDHVTNEDIFRGQAHHIDRHLRGQMDIATETYIDVIHTVSSSFPSVRVICQHGNHGELRTGNQSGQANADDLFYDRLDLAVRCSGLDNVEVVTNEVGTFTEFNLRNHRAQLRHGQDGLGHIGTNSSKKRWLAWLHDSADRYEDNGWDVAYWGHYHELKFEPIAGRPVLMGGTLAPAGDFVDSLGIASGRPGAWSHTVSDSEVVEQLKPIYFE